MKKGEGELLDLYISEKIEVLKRLPVREISRVIDAVWSTYVNNGTIYACGNGGNAAYVSNMLTDFSMHPFVSDDKSSPLPKDIQRLRTYNMTAEPATLTAILNDIGSEEIFSQQLINNRIGPEDLVFGFTGSGNSKNILRAFEVAKDYNASTVAITRGSGGRAKELADYCIIIPGDSNFPGQTGANNNNFHFEDSLSYIAHMITGIMRKRINEKYI
jgi:D-sedoheptulose 7-phosphate isomerase